MYDKKMYDKLIACFSFHGPADTLEDCLVDGALKMLNKPVEFEEKAPIYCLNWSVTGKDYVSPEQQKEIVLRFCRDVKEKTNRYNDLWPSKYILTNTVG